jgi:DNA-binding beta-propeller fold protein YncE
MHCERLLRVALAASAFLAASRPGQAATALLPDGRQVTPAGFTVPVEGFASAIALSPDGSMLAVLSQDGGAVDILTLGPHERTIDRLKVGSASALTWTSDGLYVARGYVGSIARYTVARSGGEKAPPLFVSRGDLSTGNVGLLGGIIEDPLTHQVTVARTAAREVVTLDDLTGKVLARRKTFGQPFGLAKSGDTLFATQYDSDGIAAWRGGGDAVGIPTGPHPTQILSDDSVVFVADADGHDVVEIDASSLQVERRYDLGLGTNPPPGQTPSGMALSADGRRLFVAESGYNDVALLDLASGRIDARIPTGWYPMAVVYVNRPTDEKDPRSKEQLYVASAQGLGSQEDPGAEWDGTYTGLVQHVVIEPNRFGEWTGQVSRNNRLASTPAVLPNLPPIKHVVFIVRENKQFDEEFGDEPRANADPALLVYGRHYTPNAHALAERYTLFDNFMGNGEASIYGHAWTVQGFNNDYHERNAHLRDDGTPGIDARVPYSIWPYPVAGDDTVQPSQLDFDWFHDLSDLENGPRVNVSGIFGPRGELVDELARKHVSFRVYGEQLTMESDGSIAPGLAAGADQAYPGAHIDFDVLDTTRADLFLNDVRTFGLARYSYLTLPTDHTAGTKPGFYTPASYVANNDVALGTIVAGLSRTKDWRDTIVIVTTDDPQGTGDHVDAHRQPAFAIGPWIRRGFVDHTRYSIPSILRTVEALYGLDPLSIEDAAATPLYRAFASRPDPEFYNARVSNVPMERNPGTATSFVEPLDGPDSAAIAAQERESLREGRP